MFTRLFAVASLAALAVAGPALIALRQECNTGSIQCCENTYQSGSSESNELLSKFGLVDLLLADGTFSGSNCSPFSVVGVANSGSSCQQQPICCNNNDFNGLVVVGCSPVGAFL